MTSIAGSVGEEGRCFVKLANLTGSTDMGM